MKKLSAFAIALFSSSLHLGPVLAENVSTAATKLEQSASAFLKDYEKRDKACDPTLISMYDDSARIESEIERRGEPLIKKTYTRDEYKTLVTTAFAQPATAKSAAETVYGAAKIKAEGDNQCKLEFTASHGDSAVRITWHLRRDASGDLKITREQSLTYRKSLGADKASALLESK